MHYFSYRHGEEADFESFSLDFEGSRWEWVSAPGVFARGGLDTGSRLILEHLPQRCGRLLDLGCGSGVLGLLGRLLGRARESVLVDVSFPAVRAARENILRHDISRALVLQGDGYDPVDGPFDTIVTNPPIRAGRRIVSRFLTEAPGHLSPGGSLLMVGRTKQGVRTLQALMEDAFGRPAHILARHKGYRVLRMERGSADGDRGPLTGPREKSVGAKEESDR